MAPPKKPAYTEAEKIHSAVMELLREEEDAKGDLKNTGEARALEKMRRSLQHEIAKDASEFLKSHGFTSGGDRKKVRK